jgi:hypothetical protein
MPIFANLMRENGHRTLIIREQKMKNYTIFAILFTFSISICANATSKAFSGNLQSRIGSEKPWIHYYEKNATMPDSGSLWIAIVDLQNHSIIVTTRDTVSRDTMYYHFIPGNTFKIRVSAEVNWNEEEKLHIYSYQLRSDTTSIAKIVFFTVEWMLDCREILSPHRWVGDGLYRWMSHEDKYKLESGGQLSGFGLKSSCPPRLGKFEIRGETIELGGEGWDEVSWSIAASVAGDNRSVSSKTIVPGPCPEKIEPVDWTQKLAISLYELHSLGYIDNESRIGMYGILDTLKYALMHQSEQTLQKLETHVNSALENLEAYQDDIEPEAWGYITENLKYMLRHKDVIVFKRYRRVQ